VDNKKVNKRSTRNGAKGWNMAITTLKLVMRKTKRAGVIKMIPEFEPFIRNCRRQDILSSEELIKIVSL
jgi:hypothetical protein